MVVWVAGGRRGGVSAQLVLVVGFALLLGFGLGALWSSGSGGDGTSPAAPPTSTNKAAKQVWTCSMHPQVRMDRQGTCPICSMPLILADGGEAGTPDDGQAKITLGPRAQAMAAVETVVIEKRRLAAEILTVGKIQYDETGMATLTSRVNGYVERLFLDSTGVPVEVGDELAEIYSPDLVVAQQELLIAASQGNSPLLDSSRRKLRWLGITPEQIEQILSTKKIQERMAITSPIKGTVVEKMVVEQSYVETGMMLYRLADLERVWASLEVYEYELEWVHMGQEVELTTEAYPDETFRGRVSLVNPVLDEATRTVKIRVVIPNERQRLKPGMFVRALLRSNMRLRGMEIAPSLAGRYLCPMHPEVIERKPGRCRLCGMSLVRINGRAEVPADAEEEVLAIPVSAVLDSGLRKLAYVEQDPGTYVQAELTVGPRAGDFYPVLKGLWEGDRVVVRGSMLIDSQFQIRGLPSLLSPGGASAVPVGTAAASAAVASPPPADEDW